MAVINNFANKAAAVAAGYVFTTWATPDGGYSCTAEKVMGGPSGDPDDPSFRAYAVGAVDAATAETQALKALNAQRKHRYGGGDEEADGANQDPVDDGGHPEILDVT